KWDANRRNGKGRRWHLVAIDQIKQREASQFGLQEQIVKRTTLGSQDVSSARSSVIAKNVAALRKAVDWVFGLAQSGVRRLEVVIAVYHVENLNQNRLSVRKKKK
ncbi:hypothetical protein, partial [Klebsiella pneumoniae]